jgi:hypothetical protein
VQEWKLEFSVTTGVVVVGSELAVQRYRIAMRRFSGVSKTSITNGFGSRPLATDQPVVKGSTH